MRKVQRGSVLILATAIAGLGIGSKATFAQFAWDPQQTPITPSGGSGTWDNTTLNWSNGISDVAWNSSTANFGAPGGVVTIGAPVSAAAINLNAGGYTFSSSNPANVLSLSSGTLTQSAGISGINELAGPLNFSNSTVNINGGTLKLSNTLSSAANAIINTTFNVASGSKLEFNAVTGAGSLGNGNIVLNGGTLQIDPTANGVVGSYNSHFVSSINTETTSNNYDAAAFPGSPSVLSGVINFNANNSSTPFYSGGPTVNFGARFSGAINISTAGQYSFSTTSDDGSRLYIDNRLVVVNDGPKAPSTITGAPVTLGAGLHEFRLDYTQGGGGSLLAFNYSGPDTANNSVLVPASAMQTLDPISMANNVSLTKDSSINVVGSNFTQVGMGTVTFNLSSGGSATLSINGASDKSLHLTGINLAANTTDTINTSMDVYAGKIFQTNVGVSPIIVKTGSGRLIFDNTASHDSFINFIDIREGTVEIVTSGYPTAANPVTDSTLEIDGGTLALDTKNGGSLADNPVIVTPAGGKLYAIGANSYFLGAVQLNGNLEVFNSTANATSYDTIIAPGTLTGSGNITKTPGVFTGDNSNLGKLQLQLSSPNWGGSIIVDANAGGVEGYFRNTTDQPFGPNAITLHGGYLELTRVGSVLGVPYAPGNDINADGDFSLNTGDTSTSDYSTYQLGHLTLTGARTVTQNSDGTTGAIFTGATLGGDTTFNVAGTLGIGGVTETTPSSLTKTGFGTLTLNGPSAYTGQTNLQLGTVKLGGSNALPVGTVNVAQGALDLNGNSQAINHLLSTSSGPISAGLITNTSTTASTLTLNSDSTFTGIIADGAPGQTVGLRVMSGTTTLSGLNRYSGGSFVNSGATLTSGVTVGSSGPFGTGAVTLAGGTLKLGGQQQVVPTAQGLLTQIFNSIPARTGASDPDYATLTSLSSHLAGAPVAVSVQSTTNGKDNFDFSNATVSNGTVTGTYTSQAPFGTPPSQSNDTTADYGYRLNSYFEVRFSGYINVPQAGVATFATTSDDGSMIWLDNNDTPVVNNNFYQGAVTRSGTYDFTTPGLHPITIGYYEGSVGLGLSVSWTPPGASSSHTLLNSETATGNLVMAPVQTYANDLVVSGNSSIDVNNSLAAVMGNLSIGGQLSLISSDTSGSPYGLTLGNVTLTGNSTFNVGPSAGSGAGTLTLGPITNGGSFNVTKTGGGTLVLTGSNSSPGSAAVLGGLLDVEGSIHTSGVNVMGGAVLGGKGTVLDGAVGIHSNAALAPSLSSTTPIGGPFTVQGTLSFDDSTAKLVLDLAGVTPGSGYDQLQFGSNVSLNGATLILNDSTETQALPAVQRFWILDGLPGSSSVSGLLSYQGQLLADGSTFTDSAGQQFMIDYNAAGDPNGTGHDILLSTTPEPTALGLLLASGVGLLLRRRRAREVG